MRRLELLLERHELGALCGALLTLQPEDLVCMHRHALAQRLIRFTAHLGEVGDRILDKALALALRLVHRSRQLHLVRGALLAKVVVGLSLDLFGLALKRTLRLLGRLLHRLMHGDLLALGHLLRLRRARVRLALQRLQPLALHLVALGALCLELVPFSYLALEAALELEHRLAPDLGDHREALAHGGRLRAHGRELRVALARLEAQRAHTRAA